MGPNVSPFILHLKLSGTWIISLLHILLTHSAPVEPVWEPLLFARPISFSAGFSAFVDKLRAIVDK
jgi:hypothetical protein